MTLVGAALIIWAYRRRHAGVQPITFATLSDRQEIDVRKATRTRRRIFRALLIIPLVIPSDWTQDVPDRYGERHEGMKHSRLYPVIRTPEPGDGP
jgi:hypothetical protein